MNELGFLTAIPTGITAFCATNLDDILILLLFFTQVNAEFRRRDVVFGQYLGFFGLILASLPGFFGGMLFPDAWIGLLGIVPIFIGINRLLNGEAITQRSVSFFLKISMNWSVKLNLISNITLKFPAISQI